MCQDVCIRMTQQAEMIGYLYARQDQGPPLNQSVDIITKTYTEQR